MIVIGASHFLFALYISFFYVLLPFVFCLLLFYFILFLVDVLQSGIWRDANSLVDLSLRRLVPTFSIYGWSLGLLLPYRHTDLAD